MTESGFILPMAAGVVLSWASYSIVAHVSIKRQISSLRAISWGILGTLALVLGVCAFSAVSAEHTTESKVLLAQIIHRNAMQKRTTTPSESASR